MARSVINVLYHFPCKDGFGAAWAMAQSKWPPGVELKLIPETHRFEQTAALIANPKTRDQAVIYIDICPHRADLIRLHDLAKQLNVIDHHKSAQEECGDLPYCFFDMNRSGTGLAWDLFVGGERPFLVDCIEDGDLWRWTVPNSDKVLIVLETIPFDYKVWDEFSAKLETPEGRAAIVAKGTHYSEYREKVCNMLLGRKVHKLIFHTDSGEIVLPATNASIFQSGLGNTLSKKPGPASAIYYTPGPFSKGWHFSLRSTDKGPDVSVIAARYGGGGHRNAAGFRVANLEELAAGGARFEEYSEVELDLLENQLGISFDRMMVHSILT